MLQISARTATAVLAVLTVAQLSLSISSLKDDSATADEPAHIAAGWVKLVYGRLDFYREQPPLMNSISALPLLLAGFEFPPPDAKQDHWATGHAYLFANGYASQRILILARLPTVILFSALAWTAYFFVARESGSRTWGIAAFALIAFCPTLIAHGRLATVDMAATFFCFLAGVLLVRIVREPSLPVAVFFGVAVAAAVLSKISSLILLPFAAIVAVVFMRRRVVAMTLISAAAALLTIELFILAIAGSSSITLPFRTMAMTISAIRDWYTGSNFALHFVLGRFSTESPWYYYPVALLYKMTIPSLLLSLAAIFVGLARVRTPALQTSRDAGARVSSPALFTLYSFVVLFLAVSMASDIALGIRYVLPLLPFLFCASIIRLSRVAGRKSAIAVALLIAWHTTEAIAAHPSYIGYFNQLIGSHRNADRYLIDSNLDWGQDLWRLDRWCRDNGVSAIAVCYFGGGDVESDMTVRTRRIWSAEYARDIPPGVHFALSRHLYRASSWRRVSRTSWREILERRGARYVTTVGDSIYVYVIPSVSAPDDNRYEPSIR